MLVRGDGVTWCPAKLRGPGHQVRDRLLVVVSRWPAVSLVTYFGTALYGNRPTLECPRLD
jgi:hypothetical protein